MQGICASWHGGGWQQHVRNWHFWSLNGSSRFRKKVAITGHAAGALSVAVRAAATHGRVETGPHSSLEIQVGPAEATRRLSLSTLHLLGVEFQRAHFCGSEHLRFGRDIRRARVHQIW